MSAYEAVLVEHMASPLSNTQVGSTKSELSGKAVFGRDWVDICIPMVEFLIHKFRKERLVICIFCGTTRKLGSGNQSMGCLLGQWQDCSVQSRDLDKPLGLSKPTYIRDGTQGEREEETDSCPNKQLKEEFGVVSSLLVEVVATTGGPYGEKLGEELDENSELFAVGDRKDPIWVPERLVRKVQPQLPDDEVDITAAAAAATPSPAESHGATLGDSVCIPEADADTA
ncbi:hypothetical protein STEG23_038092 [Scotinomys teguina]